jgi:hypothetical protein
MDGPDMDRLRLDLADIPLPLAPAWPWISLIVAFPNFMDAVRFGYAVALADKIVKKLVTPIAWPAPEAFRPIRAHCPDRQAIMIATVAESAVAAFKSLLSRRHPTGSITFEQPSADAPGDVPLYEFTWNRTTLQVLKRERGITYLQALRPAGRLLDSVAEIAGPHVFTPEDGAGHKQVDADLLSFKRRADPHGLLYPGKDAEFFFLTSPVEGGRGRGTIAPRVRVSRPHATRPCFRNTLSRRCAATCPACGSGFVVTPPHGCASPRDRCAASATPASGAA